MKPIIIHTVCFGDHYFDVLERGLIPSLLWKLNAAALEIGKAKWCIYVKNSDSERALNICLKVLPREQIEVITSIPERLKFESPDRGTVLLDCLNQTAEKCIEESRSMIMALPDFIFGNGSIRAFMEWGYGDNCVIIPHPRVLPGILNEITDKPMSNAELVSAVWRNLHRSWLDCEVGLFQLGSYIGGVSWRHMPDNIIAVQHRIPSVGLANFTREDVDYFNQWNGAQAPGFGRYDWAWPSECLIEQQRQRTICSSDVGFWCEVTLADQNCPPRQSMPSNEPDAFFLDNRHTRANRMIISSYRHDGSIK